MSHSAILSLIWNLLACLFLISISGQIFGITPQESRITTSEFIPMMTSLTSEQIAIIQSTWAIPAKNAIDSGEAILLAYFEKYPKNQDKFNSFKNTPLLSLKGTPGFRTHAGRIMAVFQEAISSLSNENYVEELERIWNQIGETHQRRKISRQSFEELRDVIVSVLVAVCSLDDEGKTAWGTLMDIIYHIVYTKLDEKTPY